MVRVMPELTVQVSGWRMILFEVTVQVFDGPLHIAPDIFSQDILSLIVGENAFAS
jgi:hypothetical protein